MHLSCPLKQLHVQGHQSFLRAHAAVAQRHRIPSKIFSEVNDTTMIHPKSRQHASYDPALHELPLLCKQLVAKNQGHQETFETCTCPVCTHANSIGSTQWCEAVMSNTADKGVCSFAIVIVIMHLTCMMFPPAVCLVADR